MADYSTIEGCLAAVQDNGRALEWVPADKQTPEMCLAAVRQEGWALQYVPDDKKTPELFLAAVQHDGLVLRDIPDDKKTPEICLAAVRQDGWALRFVPESKKTPEVIAAAIANEPEADKYIKKQTIVHHGEPQKMPPNAYDTLEMGYDDYSAIKEGELMVDFHSEFAFGRFYRKATFESMVLPSKKNPTTRAVITEYTIYQAAV